MLVAAILGIAISAAAVSQEITIPVQSANAVERPSNAPEKHSVQPCSPVYTVGGSVQPPIAIYTPDPKFPKQARDAKISGNVVVALVVGRDGKPCNVHLVRGVGMGLDESAVEVVQHYRFRPATQNGKPVAANLNVEVNFSYHSR